MSKNSVKNESGLVSIMVTMIMILVISLIVLGFAQVTRTNQREALDRQLSTQAFYAAETGVNDAKTYIRAHTTTPSSTSCTDFITTAGLTTQQYLNTDHSVGYSCLMLNNSPKTLQYNVSNNAAIATPLFSEVGHPIQKITITWQANNNNTANSNGCSTGNQLPPTTSWGCEYGLLRLDLMPDIAGGSGAATFANNTQTFFVKPSNSGSGTTTVSTFSGAQRARIVPVHCTTPAPITPTSAGTCSTTITLNNPPQTNYYARLSASYNDLKNVVISANAGVTFRGAQAVIDSTGKAQDVLRRLQVRVNLLGNSLQPAAGLQTTGSICKLISVINGAAENPDCTGSPPSIAGNAVFAGCSNAACDGSSGPGGGGVVHTLTWGVQFKNTSGNARSLVVRCTWDWGDGVWGDPKPVMTSPILNGADDQAAGSATGPACYPGEFVYHEFYPKLANPTKCYYYNVKLTIYLTNGLTPTYVQRVRQPYGTLAPDCKATSPAVP